MKITNQQALSSINCKHMPNSCKGCESIGMGGICGAGKIEEYAADLLEARKIITEMREFIDTAVYDSITYDMDADAILEKTKEYE